MSESTDDEAGGDGETKGSEEEMGRSLGKEGGRGGKGKAVKNGAHKYLLGEGKWG